MRILQIISVVKNPMPDDPGGIYGAERSTVLLCRGLIQRGHDLQLICARDAPLLGLARDAQIPVTPMILNHRRDLFTLWRIARAARQMRAQILVSHDPMVSRISFLLGRVLGLPVVATVRGLYSVRHYERAPRLIAVSQGVERHIVERGVAPERVRVVYNGVQTNRFVPTPDLAAAKRAIGLSNAQNVVGVVGRLSAEKGHAWFLEAAARLAPHPATCFLLVGDGPQRAAIEANAARLGLGAQLRCAGYQSDIIPWLAAMDMLVLPSITHEGFARTLIEAGAMEKPCVTSPVGGNAEAVEHEKTGLVVPVHDVEALSQAMRQLLNSPGERRRMGIAARQRVMAHFSVESMVEKTEAVYRELVADS